MKPSETTTPAGLEDDRGEAARYFDEGRLEPAIDAQTEYVKTHPADPDSRLFLFELLALAGQWDRAARQIAALHYDDPALAHAAQVYANLIRAEGTRRDVFAGEASPRVVAPAPEHVSLRIEAAGALARDDADRARELLGRAAELLPAVAGTLDGQPVDAFRDCDDLMGTTLEVMADTGEYFWVGLDQVEQLTIRAAATPRDLLWLAAELTLSSGRVSQVFLPALYPDPQGRADDPVKLGRVTDWHQPVEGVVLGVGARLFVANDQAKPMIEIGELNVG